MILISNFNNLWTFFIYFLFSQAPPFIDDTAATQPANADEGIDIQSHGIDMALFNKILTHTVSIYVSIF